MQSRSTKRRYRNSRDSIERKTVNWRGGERIGASCHVANDLSAGARRPMAGIRGIARVHLPESYFLPSITGRRCIAHICDPRATTPLSAPSRSNLPPRVSTRDTRTSCVKLRARIDARVSLRRRQRKGNSFSDSRKKISSSLQELKFEKFVEWNLLDLTESFVKKRKSIGREEVEWFLGGQLRWYGRPPP